MTLTILGCGDSSSMQSTIPSTLESTNIQSSIVTKPFLPDGEGIWTEYYDELISINEANSIATAAGSTATTERYYVYGTYSADGKERYSALEDKPVAGDEVVLYVIYPHIIIHHRPRVDGLFHSITLNKLLMKLNIRNQLLKM